MNSMANPLACLDQVSLNDQEVDDSWTWIWDSKGAFSVCSMYWFFAQEHNNDFSANLDLDPHRPYEGGIPHVVVVLGSGSNHGCLNAQRFPMAKRCPLCCQDCETMSQLFLHCPQVTIVWSFFYARFWVAQVMPKSLKDLILC